MTMKEHIEATMSKPEGNAYEITYEVRTALGNAVWHTVVAYGKDAVAKVNKCHAVGYKIIGIRQLSDSLPR